MFKFTVRISDQIICAYEDVLIAIRHQTPLFFVVLQIMVEILFKQADSHLNISHRINSDRGLGEYIKDYGDYLENLMYIKDDEFMGILDGFFGKKEFTYIKKLNYDANQYKHAEYNARSNFKEEDVQEGLLFVHNISKHIYKSIFNDVSKEKYDRDEISDIWNYNFYIDSKLEKLTDGIRESTERILELSSIPKENTEDGNQEMMDQIENHIEKWLETEAAIKIEEILDKVVALDPFMSEIYYAFLVYRMRRDNENIHWFKWILSLKIGDTTLMRDSQFQEKTKLYIHQNNQSRKIAYIYKVLPPRLLPICKNFSIWWSFLQFIELINPTAFSSKILKIDVLANDEGILHFHAARQIGKLKTITKEVEESWQIITKT